MASANERDPVMDELLARALSRDAVGSVACVDAEELAAWTDRTLPDGQMAQVEAHVAGCARCQAVAAAIVRSAPQPPPVESLWARLQLQWLVPVVGTAAAIGIYIATRPPSAPAPELMQSRAEVAAPELVPEATTPPAAPLAPPPSSVSRDRLQDQVGARPEASSEADAAAKTAPAAAEGRRVREAAPPPPAAAFTAESSRADAGASGAPPAAAPLAAAPPPAPPSPASANLTARAVVSAAPLDVRAPGGAERWRVAAGAVEHSLDSGATWQSTQGVTATGLRAGSSPSPGVCWLVGTGGSVWMTQDGVRFAQLTVPAAVDLTEVAASSARSAVVTTTDGRRFSTTDGGATWTVVP